MEDREKVVMRTIASEDQRMEVAGSTKTSKE
jgi:hypothetical protein